MKYVHYHKATGATCCIATQPADTQDMGSLELPDNLVGVVVGVNLDPLRLIVAPERPQGLHHTWDGTHWQDTRTAASQWPTIRAERDRRLIESDWVATKAFEVGGPVPDTWKAYRQALRDITLQADPFAVVWPARPQ